MVWLTCEDVVQDTTYLSTDLQSGFLLPLSIDVRKVLKPSIRALRSAAGPEWVDGLQTLELACTVRTPSNRGSRVVAAGGRRS